MYVRRVISCMLGGHIMYVRRVIRAWGVISSMLGGVISCMLGGGGSYHVC